MINLQDTPSAGPLTAADLDEARAYSTGRIYRLHRVTVCPPCDGMCNQGRDCNAESCASEGGTFADPVPSGIVSMRRHRDIRDTVLLIAGLALTGYLAHIVWPLVA